MKDDDLESQLSQPVTTLRIIVSALAMGALMFAGVVHFVIEGDAPQPEGLMSRMGMVMGFVALVVAPWVGRSVASGGVKQWAAGGGGDPARLYPFYQTSTIVSMAIREGAAFLNIIAYMQERNLLSLGMAGLLVAANLLHFPTTGGVADWCRRQERRAREENWLKADR